MRLDPIDVQRKAVRDAWSDVATAVPQLVGASVHLAGELLLQAGARGRVVRLLVGQPVRETCRLGWGGRVFDRMEACR